MEITTATFFAGLAIILMVVRYGFYFSSIYKKETRPHMFSWFNWGVLTMIGGVAQLKVDINGLSGWILIVVASSCFLISFLALFVGEKNITRGDWITFLVALGTIPVWMYTGNPVTALIILIAIDALSYYPTFRKTWADPTSEPAYSTFLAGARYFCLLFTIQNPDWQNLIYPVFLMSADWLFALMIVTRRAMIKKQLT
jgi:hypothetical protein